MPRLIGLHLNQTLDVVLVLPAFAWHTAASLDVQVLGSCPHQYLAI